MSEDKHEKHERSVPKAVIVGESVGKARKDAPPVAPLTAAEAGEGPESSAEVEVLPVRTEPSVRIGDGWYSFVAGKRVLVPRVIVAHLERVGIVAPSIH